MTDQTADANEVFMNGASETVFRIQKLLGRYGPGHAVARIDALTHLGSDNLRGLFSDQELCNMYARTNSPILNRIAGFVSGVFGIATIGFAVLPSKVTIAVADSSVDFNSGTAVVTGGLSAAFGVWALVRSSTNCDRSRAIVNEVLKREREGMHKRL